MKRTLLAVWLLAGLGLSAATPIIIGLSDSGVTAGTYSNSVITIDAKGRVTSAVSGLGSDLSTLTNSINGGFPNGTGALIHWSQLFGVPAGFADGTDDGTGGGSLLVNGGTGGTNLVDTADLLWTATGGSISGSLSGLKAAQLWQSTNAALTRLSGIGAGTSGDTYYRDATGWTNLVKGADGMIYIMSGGFPAWSSNITELVVSDLVVSNAFPASYVSNSTPNRFIISGPTGLLTNDIAETGTGAPVRAASPAFTGTPTVNGTNAMAEIDGKQPLDPDLTTLGTLNASALTNLNATELRSGTVPTNRLDSNTTQLAVNGSVGTGPFIRNSEYDSLSTNKTYESVFLDFVGGDATKAIYPGLFTAISSGQSATAASDGTAYRPHYMKGLFYITTASGVALNTGGTLSLFVQNQYLHTNESHFEMNGAIVATNTTVANLGYGDFLNATTADIDALKFAITNDVIYGSAINNSSETLTTTSFNYVPNFYYRWQIDATNDTARFTLSSNGVVVWTDYLATGIPRLARQTTPLIRIWNGATAHTNSATLMILDNIGYKWSKAP